ncbi:MAG: ATP-binding protein [Syntrophales bacterium]|nr:ATP-binding protein [Syntrophales bacterium]MDD5640741.1 ATP-binding protein [Syntrophales bacterium]
MTTMPLFPIWFFQVLGSVAVLVFSLLSLRITRRLTARDPENALWLFLDWLTMGFVIFSISHAVSHFLQEIINYYGPSQSLWQLRRAFGGLDSIIYVVIAATTLFFHRIQRLYRRMEADHHHLEETSHEILALNREMEALVMERTMSEMALGMAHGIRNPLHVIGGFSHRLLRKTDPDDPTRAWLSTIAEEARRIEQMVSRFESLAQRKESFFNQEDLNSIVSTTLQLLRPELNAKNITLVTSFHPEPLVGRLNGHLLKVAISHLIRNAVEATRPRGKITVRTLVEKDYAVLTIQDTGKGMPPDVVDKVFVPFYTTKIGGTGLGMVFVRQIVDEHRGVITLDSKVGRGTTVTIRLPYRFAEKVELEEAPQTPPAAEAPPESSGGAV